MDIKEFYYRYSKRRRGRFNFSTSEAVKLAYELGHSIILITDHISCPIISYASVTLKVEVSEEQFSVIPIIALLDALVIEIGKRSSEESIKKLKRLEKTLIEKDVLFSY